MKVTSTNQLDVGNRLRGRKGNLNYGCYEKDTLSAVGKRLWKLLQQMH